MEHPVTITPLLPGDVHAAYLLETELPGVHGQLLWHSRTPYAHALKAELVGALVGYAFGLVHNGSGWVRELYVRPAVFGEGVGTALVGALLRWTEAQGAGAQGVVAAPGTEAFWMRLGFVPELELLAYGEGTFTEATRGEVVPLLPEHLLGLLHLDRRATGEDRSTWLREHMHLGQAWLEGGRVRGFLLPLLGRGLVVADAPAVGLELQRWLWPVQAELVLPVGAAQAHAHLVKQGCTTRPAGLRMWRGTAPPFRPELVFAWPHAWG